MFRKVPVVIEAERVADLLESAAAHWQGLPLWLRDEYERGNIVFARDAVLIKTREGDMRGDLGDWIIRGVKGEIYPCKPEIFDITYVPEVDADAA